MFKGYIETDGKIPKSSVISGNLLRQPPSVGDYGGVLNDDIVMIDVDEFEQSEKLLSIINELNLNCNVLTTSRGKHFYFKNTNLLSNKIHVNSACGIIIDIKLGTKNTVVPLRVMGTDRSFLQTGEELDELPIWLHPVKSCPDFQNLKDGDGRNQTLFNYILTLQSEGFDIEQIKTTIEVINKYILKDKLGERELNTILREDAFKKPSFFIKKEFQHHKFAQWLKLKYHVCKINDVLHFYESGSYSHFKNLFAKMIHEIEISRKAQRQEVWHYLNDLIVDNKQQSSVKYVNCANGVLDLENMELIEHSPEYLITNKIPTNYNSDAKCELVDTTLLKLSNGDPNMKMLLEEILGYCLYRRNELGKFFVLTGEGGCGKSTYLDMITQVLGENNISSISLQNLSERFQNTEIVGKLANIGDDISDRYVDDNSDLKKLTTGEAMQFEEKGQKPFRYKSYAKLLFASNKLPRINDTTDGLMRRIVTVPFQANFTKSAEYDPFIIDKLTTKEALEYFLLLGIEGLKRILVNRKFTSVDAVTREAQEYEETNNPIIAFVNEGNKIENESVDDVYRKYTVWCAENGYNAKSKIAFSKELKRKFKIESYQTKQNDKNIRLFRKSVTDEINI